MEDMDAILGRASFPPYIAIAVEDAIESRDLLDGLVTEETNIDQTVPPDSVRRLSDDDLAALDVHVQAVMNHIGAKGGLQAADLDSRYVHFHIHHMPIAVKKTAKKASRTITRKID